MITSTGKTRRLFIVRHGQSEGNVNPKLYLTKNDCDISLTNKGERDAINAAKKIMEINDTIHKESCERIGYNLLSPPLVCNIYTSPYKRAYQTANIILDYMTTHEGIHINKFIENPLLREREWGGLRDIKNSGESCENHFNFFYRPVGGESFADGYQRAVIFDQWLLNHNTYEDAIIVAHGEFNKLYMMNLLGWTISEFENWRNSKNGEVFYICDNKLSSYTPLTRRRLINN